MAEETEGYSRHDAGGDSGVRESRAEQGRAGVQGGTGGGAEAAGEPGAAGERTGGGERRRSRAKAEEAERSAAIRAELQRLGVAKLDLAYKAVKDEIHRSEDGRLMAQDGTEMRDYLAQFVERESGAAAGAAGGRVGRERRGRGAAQAADRWTWTRSGRG